ncbi:MAG: hypothetical protein H0V07_15685, partial [Propionibacteriales bacterium]|nr:hypothetical protein [Propionibacteriales bacterium]
MSKRTAVTLACLMAGLIGVGVAGGQRVALVTAVAAVGLTLVLVIVTAADPRQVAVMSIAVVLPTSVATGLQVVGPVPLSAFAPPLVLALTLLPGVCQPSTRQAREMWGLAVAAVMAIGGLCATTAGNGSWVAIAAFLVTTLPAVLAMWRLNPDQREIQVLLLGILSGVVVSTILGVLAFRYYASGRAVGLTHHPN